MGCEDWLAANRRLYSENLLYRAERSRRSKSKMLRLVRMKFEHGRFSELLTILK